MYQEQLLIVRLKSKSGSEENYDELRYEGFGPNGSMVIVDTLTNNVNRTVQMYEPHLAKTVVTWA